MDGGDEEEVREGREGRKSLALREIDGCMIPGVKKGRFLEIDDSFQRDDSRLQLSQQNLPILFSMILTVNRTPRLSPVIGRRSCRYAEMAVPVQ